MAISHVPYVQRYNGILFSNSRGITLRPRYGPANLRQFVNTRELIRKPYYFPISARPSFPPIPWGTSVIGWKLSPCFSIVAPPTRTSCVQLHGSGSSTGQPQQAIDQQLPAQYVCMYVPLRRRLNWPETNVAFLNLSILQHQGLMPSRFCKWTRYPVV